MPRGPSRLGGIPGSAAKKLYDPPMAGFEDIGAALTVLRNRAGLSQEDLASRMGLKGGNSVSAIENGNPRVSSIHRYLMALQCSPMDLALELEQMSYTEEPPLGQPEVREAPAVDVLDQLAIDFNKTMQSLVEEVKRRSPKN